MDKFKVNQDTVKRLSKRVVTDYQFTLTPNDSANEYFGQAISLITITKDYGDKPIIPSLMDQATCVLNEMTIDTRRPADNAEVEKFVISQLKKALVNLKIGPNYMPYGG